MSRYLMLQQNSFGCNKDAPAAEYCSSAVHYVQYDTVNESCELKCWLHHTVGRRTQVEVARHTAILRAELAIG
jgi:hypothetical protein